MSKEIDFKAIEEKTGSICLNYCQAACCRNMNFEGMPKDQFDRLTANSEELYKVNTSSELYTSVYHSAASPKGVYFLKKGEKYQVGIKGDCPNLQPDNSCGIYETRPEACRSFPVGAEGCKNSRKELGMKPLEKVIPEEFIPLSPVKKIVRKIIRANNSQTS